MPQFDFATAVLAWFDQHGRHDLPWQAHKTPYHTWVSEIMLQQTQVSTVIPYFQRFIARFPDVQTLATAELDNVLHLWTGLGYYARARNLHKTAQLVCVEHDGRFPASAVELQRLPGIGRSTAAAIASIACGERAAILDGNVKRVLARFHALESWPGTAAAQQQLWQWADSHTPDRRCGDYTQAMMDLGATLCTRSRPQCDTCPLSRQCQAFLQQRTHELPRPRPKKSLPQRSTLMLLLRNAAGEVLLEQRPPSGIWGGLWSLPEVAQLDELAARIGFHPSAEHLQHLPELTHTFSHYQLRIQPLQIQLNNPAFCVMDAAPTLWYNIASPTQKIGLAAPVKKLLQLHQTSSNWSSP